MNGVNKVILLGRVGQEPEINEFSGGKSAQMSIATTERGYKTKTGKEIPERTEWHRVVCFGALADIVSRYIQKGSAVYIEGKIRTRSYNDKQGQKKYTTEVHAEQIQLLDKKQETQKKTEQDDDIPF